MNTFDEQWNVLKFSFKLSVVAEKLGKIVCNGRFVKHYFGLIGTAGRYVYIWQNV